MAQGNGSKQREDLNFICIESTADAASRQYTAQITRVVSLTVSRRRVGALKQASGRYAFADGKSTETCFLYVDGVPYHLAQSHALAYAAIWPNPS